MLLLAPTSPPTSLCTKDGRGLPSHCGENNPGHMGSWWHTGSDLLLLSCPFQHYFSLGWCLCWPDVNGPMQGNCKLPAPHSAPG